MKMEEIRIDEKHIGWKYLFEDLLNISIYDNIKCNKCGKYHYSEMSYCPFCKLDGEVKNND